MTTKTPHKARTPRWKRRPEHRPAQIIQAALEVFGKKGLARTRLEDIATRAGVSKGTIYLYFENKEALFKEMVRETAIAVIERGEERPTSGSPSDQLRYVMANHWEFVRTPAFSTIHRLVIGELHQFPDLARFYADEVITRGMNLITGIIRRGIDAGEFRETDPAAAARMLVALFVMNGVWCDKRECLPVLEGRTDDRAFADISDFYFSALRPSTVATAQADGA
ncbi:MAG: TetR/AcrR family transcriptional regulator [Gemmatimonadaceae bacterium]|nr:TetR/AcrR family transcriptional regulator [Gemmatimonadaceae bacterium]MBA3644648.1 TetR/AcrR family transcriptional regulator [Gemmatimonadaceae bacterium]